MSKLSHLDDQGAARMVDVSDKPVTAREASAEAVVHLSAEAFTAAMEGSGPKGEVLAAARIAGIMAAKKTSELIPLCHPLPITKAEIAFEPDAGAHRLRVIATVKTQGQTGVEMEALTAASIAALTVYDMVKAVDKSAVIETIRLLTKSGGKSGDYRVPEVKATGRAKGYRSAPGAAPKPSAPMDAAAAPKPSAPMDAAAAPKPSADAAREVLRAFMTARHLRASEWAKAAGVPPAHIYGFLTGRARAIPQDSLEKLAAAAKVGAGALSGGR